MSAIAVPDVVVAIRLVSPKSSGRMVVIGSRSITSFHGARLRLHNTQPRSLPYRLRYTAKDNVTGKSMVFRTQNRTAKADEEATAQYPLPALHPLTGNRWTLTSLEVQVQSPKLPKDFELSPLIVELVLFEDTLK